MVLTMVVCGACCCCRGLWQLVASDGRQARAKLGSRRRRARGYETAPMEDLDADDVDEEEFDDDPVDERQEVVREEQATSRTVGKGRQKHEQKATRSKGRQRK